MELFNLISDGDVNPGTFVTELVFALCAVIVLGRPLRTARDVARLVLELLLFYLAQSLLGVLAYVVVGLPYNGAPSLEALIGTLVLYALCQRRLTATDRIVRCTTFASYFVIVVGMTTVFLPAMDWLRVTSFAEVVPSVVSYLVMLGFAVILRTNSIGHCAYTPRSYLALIVLVDFLGAAVAQSFTVGVVSYTLGTPGTVMTATFDDFERTVLLATLFADVSFLVLVIAAYLLFSALAREHDERAELLVIKKSEADALSQMRVASSVYESLRKARHELKNHDAYMAALLKEGDYEALEEYFRAYETRNAEVLCYVASGNPAVDAIVNAKIALARSEGIEVKSILAAPPVLPLAEGDLYRLLANMLDNAIEGASASGAEHPTVTIKLRPEGGYLFFIVANPCDARALRWSRAGLPLTTKKDDGDIHGFGTKVISEIAEKYRGKARFAVEDGVFVANVMVAMGRKG